MSQVPDVSGRWINRDSLGCVQHCHVYLLGSAGEYVHLEEVSTVDCSQSIPLAEFQREFVKDGPVTLEALESLGWRIDGMDARLHLEESSGAGCLAWDSVRSRLTYVAGDPWYMADLACKSLHHVLLAMRVFGVPIPTTVEQNNV